MNNFDFTNISVMISTMNLKKLNDFQNMIQEEIQTAIANQNKAIEELKNTLFETLQKLVSLSGNFDLVDEAVQKVKAGHPVNDVVDDEESPVCMEQETEEQVSVIENTEPEKENIVLPEYDHLPSFAELLGEESVNDIDENIDSFEYSNEEEYNLTKKRARMLQPLDVLLSDDITPRISEIGYAKPQGTAFLQNERILDPVGGCGNTLTASSAPYVYIPMNVAQKTA